MGHFVSGVTVVTTFEDDGRNDLAPGDRRPHGITVNALSSVSLDPPMILVALDRRRRITPVVRGHRRFAVNILGEDQQALSDCFAGAPVTPDREAFCGAAWTAGTTGLPLIDGAIASLECSTVDVVSAGDHDLFIARVDALTNDEHHAMPLLYYRRRYLQIDQASSVAVAGKPEE